MGNCRNIAYIEIYNDLKNTKVLHDEMIIIPRILTDLKQTMHTIMGSE